MALHVHCQMLFSLLSQQEGRWKTIWLPDSRLQLESHCWTVLRTTGDVFICFPSPSMMVAANTAILYKTMMFFYPNQEFVVCKSSQSRKIENIKTRLVLNYLRFCRTVLYIFILAIGLKVSLVEMLVSVNQDQVFIFYKSSLVF